MEEVKERQRAYSNCCIEQTNIAANENENSHEATIYYNLSNQLPCDGSDCTNLF